MPDKKKPYRTIACMPPELWKEVKLQAFKEDKYVYQWVTEAIMEKLKKKKEKE